MPGKILLADDSVTIQKVVSLILADTEYELVSVSDGDSAVEKISEIKPDLVIVDAAMPGKNGYEVCRYVKGTPFLKHIPVLLLTGTFEPINEEDAKNAGIDNSIVKPFDSQELIDKVTNLLLHPKITDEKSTAETLSEATDLTTANNMEDIPLIEPLEEIEEIIEVSAHEPEPALNLEQETTPTEKTEEIAEETSLQEEPQTLETTGFATAVDTPLKDSVERAVEKTVEEMAKKLIPDIAERVIREEMEKIKNLLLKTIAAGA